MYMYDVKGLERVIYRRMKGILYISSGGTGKGKTGESINRVIWQGRSALLNP